MSSRNRIQTDRSGDHARNVVGGVSLFCGVGLLGLLLIDATYGLSLSMPASWYSNRTLWGGLSFVLVGVGWFLLHNRGPQPTGWSPSKPGSRFNHVTLYTREGCHLCDTALEMLEKYRAYIPAVEEVDIDAEQDLRQRFDTCVPVVEIDGKVRFRGKIDELLLRRLIEGTAPA